jgi:hypothetical protein
MVSRNKLLSDFKADHQFVNMDFRMEQRDAVGNMVENEDYSLGDGGEGVYNPYDNSRDTGLI